MLLLKDTENHPDVIAQRKLIELLKTQQARTDPTAATPAKAGDARARPC